MAGTTTIRLVDTPAAAALVASGLSIRDVGRALAPFFRVTAIGERYRGRPFDRRCHRVWAVIHGRVGDAHRMELGAIADAMDALPWVAFPEAFDPPPGLSVDGRYRAA